MIAVNGIAGTFLAVGALADGDMEVAGFALPVVWVELLVMVALIVALMVSERTRRRARRRPTVPRS